MLGTGFANKVRSVPVGLFLLPAFPPPSRPTTMQASVFATVGLSCLFTALGTSTHDTS